MKYFMLIFCTLPLFLSAQEEEIQKVKRVTKVETGYMFGGIINLNYFASNGAFSLAAGHGVNIIDRLQIIPTIGVDRFQDGILFPFYADINAYMGKGKKGFVDFKIGYSLGTNKVANVNIDYRYKGGTIFSMGYGANLYKSEKIKLSMAITYNLRNAGITYRPYDDEDRITSRFSYHLVGGKIAATF